MKFNYVLFNAYDNRHHINKDGYYYICVEDLLTSADVNVVTLPLENYSSWVRLLFDIHNSAKIERYLDLPMKKLWYPYYFKDGFSNDKPYCFIILNHYLPVDYLRYLKSRYANCRIVLLHRDLIQVSHRMNKFMSQNRYLDIEMTFDKGESKLYGFPHFNEFESKINIPVESKMESDVFFAGKSKGRLQQLVDAYEVFSNAGLKCYYYITGVPVEKRVDLPGVVFADEQMTYREMLYHTVNTRCVLEINQAKCDGFTSRYLEAVMYGKRLITNNSEISKSRFYSPEKIQIINKATDVNPEFIRQGLDFVDYDYRDDFSPHRMIERVEEELIKRYG